MDLLTLFRYADTPLTVAFLISGPLCTAEACEMAETERNRLTAQHVAAQKAKKKQKAAEEAIKAKEKEKNAEEDWKEKEELEDSEKNSLFSSDWSSL